MLLAHLLPFHVDDLLLMLVYTLHNPQEITAAIRALLSRCCSRSERIS